MKSGYNQVTYDKFLIKNRYLYFIIAIGTILLFADILWWQSMKTWFEIDGYTFSLSRSSAERNRQNQGVFGRMNRDLESADRDSFDSEIRQLRESIRKL